MGKSRQAAFNQRTKDWVKIDLYFYIFFVYYSSMKEHRENPLLAIEVLFLEMALPPNWDQKTYVKGARDNYANPKAVAAQAHKSQNIEVEFYESRRWEKLASFFEAQYLGDERDLTDFKCPIGGRWISYPFSVSSQVVKHGCIVWRSRAKPWVQHVRLYSTMAHAVDDNAAILRILTARDYSELR